MQPFEFYLVYRAVSACQLSRSPRCQISKRRAEIVATLFGGNDDNTLDLQPRTASHCIHHTNTMTNPLDTDAGSELFSSYEAELKLVQADLNQKLDQIPDLSGEPRKAAISQADRPTS